MRTSDARLLDTLIAGVAAWSALLPLGTLFQTYAWSRPAIVITLIVLGVGLLGRMVTRRRELIALAQLLAGLETSVLLFAPDRTWYGLWNWDTVLAFNDQLYLARITVMQYAAPAPTNGGIIVALSLLTLLFVLLIDYFAITRRSPALAGVPLVTAYLVTATNSGATLKWYYFAAPAALWLVMLARAGTGSLERWATLVSRPTSGARTRDPVDSYAALARNLGILALGAALLLPNVIPHFPTRFLAEGLGRADSATGSGGFSLSTTVDLRRNLADPSSAPVLTYRTSDPTPSPLRVAILDSYAGDGNFRLDPDMGFRPVYRGNPLGALDLDRVDPGVALALKDVPEANIVRGQAEFRNSTLRQPQIALPYGAQFLDAPGAGTVTEYANRQVGVEKPAAAYTVDTIEVIPPVSLLRSSRASTYCCDGFDAETVSPRDLSVDPFAQSALQQVLGEQVPADASDYEAALAIQDYLRSTAFTYSLELAPDPGGVRSPTNAFVHFLNTKQGYCQQFAGTMVMLARARGIPARMVIGFLPGSLEQGERTVLRSDAHAWPELYFEPFGWIRFEPTPAGRSGAVPAWAVEETATPTSSETQPSSSASSTTRRVQPNADDVAAPLPTTLDRPVWDRIGELSRGTWVLVAVALGLIAALVLPITSAILRRRRFAAAEDAASLVEARWQELIARVGDLGIDTPRTMTPRQIQEHLTERAVLSRDPANALSRVVSAVEGARYGGPGTTFADPEEDVDAVLDAVGSTRSMGLRARALLLPSNATRAFGRAGARLAGLPTRVTGAVGDWVRSLRPPPKDPT